MPHINSSFTPQANPFVGGAAHVSPGKISPEAAAAQFTSVFLQSMMREIFKNKSKNELFGSNNAVFDYSDMFADRMISELAENDAFGLNKIVETGINKKHAGKSQ